MQELNNINEQEQFFSESLLELQEVNKHLAQLLLRKETITENIIEALQHDHEGQKSYQYGIWKIEIHTPFVYSLNKKLYESGEIKLPDNYNPIKESISYSLDKRLVDKYMQEAPVDVRDALIELIDKKPGKANIVVKERI